MVPYVPRRHGISRETGPPPSRLIRAARRYRAPRLSGAAVITFRLRGVCPVLFAEWPSVEQPTNRRYTDGARVVRALRRLPRARARRLEDRGTADGGRTFRSRFALVNFPIPSPLPPPPARVSPSLCRSLAEHAGSPAAPHDRLRESRGRTNTRGGAGRKKVPGARVRPQVTRDEAALISRFINRITRASRVLPSSRASLFFFSLFFYRHLDKRFSRESDRAPPHRLHARMLAERRGGRRGKEGRAAGYFVREMSAMRARGGGGRGGGIALPGLATMSISQRRDSESAHQATLTLTPGLHNKAVPIFIGPPSRRAGNRRRFPRHPPIPSPPLGAVPRDGSFRKRGSVDRSVLDRARPVCRNRRIARLRAREKAVEERRKRPLRAHLAAVLIIGATVTGTVRSSRDFRVLTSLGRVNIG